MGWVRAPDAGLDRKVDDILREDSGDGLDKGEELDVGSGFWTWFDVSEKSEVVSPGREWLCLALCCGTSMNSDSSSSK